MMERGAQHGRGLLQFSRSRAVLQVDEFDTGNGEDRPPKREFRRATSMLDRLAATPPGDADFQPVTELGETTAPPATLRGARGQIPQAFRKGRDATPQEARQAPRRTLHGHARSLDV